MKAWKKRYRHARPRVRQRNHLDMNAHCRGLKAELHKHFDYTFPPLVNKMLDVTKNDGSVTTSWKKQH